MKASFLHLIFLLLAPLVFGQNHDSCREELDAILKKDIKKEVKIKLVSQFLSKQEKKISSKTRSYAYHKLGLLYYGINAIESAIEETKKAVRLRSSKEQFVDYFLLNNSLNNLFFYYKKKGATNNCLQTLFRIITNPSNDKYTYNAYISLGYTFANQGDYFTAIDCLHVVINEYGIKHEHSHILLLAHRAAIYVYSKIDETKRNLSKITHHEKEINRLKTLFGGDDDPAVFNNLGNLYEGFNLVKKAKKEYLKSLDLYQKENDTLNMGRVYNNLGRVFNKLQDYEQADYYFNKGLRVTNDIQVKAAIYSNFGDRSNFIEKISYNKKAIEEVLQKKNIKDFSLEIRGILDSPYKLDILDYLIEILKGHIHIYKTDKNEESLRQAVKICDLTDVLFSSFRIESLVDTSKLFWIRKAAKFYMIGVELCYFEKNTAKAFYFMEKNKGLLLLENINKIQHKEKIIPISLDGYLNKYIDDDQSFVEYIVNEEEGFGIFCNKEQRLFFKLKNVPDLLKNIVLLRKKMQKHFVLKEDKTVYNVLANKVFKRLFPFKVPLGKKMIIIPDYTLQHINFEALIPSITDPKYLVYSTEISYLLSASIFFNLEKIPSKDKEKQLLVFAPISFKDKSLTPLVRSKETIKKITKNYSNKVFIKNKATKKAFFNEIKKYEIIHINSHAGLEEKSGEPWLAFYDKKITLDEIAEKTTNTKLVVLDACNGASGKQETGEGVMSLSRSFINGGTKSVVTTQWKANEKSVNSLITSFYQELRTGKTKSAALRKAKLDYLKTHQLSEVSPYYWASLILLGNNDAIETKSPYVLYWIWGIITTLIVFFFLILMVKHLYIIRNNNQK